MFVTSYLDRDCPVCNLDLDVEQYCCSPYITDICPFCYGLLLYVGNSNTSFHCYIHIYGDSEPCYVLNKITRGPKL